MSNSITDSEGTTWYSAAEELPLRELGETANLSLSVIGMLRCGVCPVVYDYESKQWKEWQSKKPVDVSHWTHNPFRSQKKNPFVWDSLL